MFLLYLFLLIPLSANAGNEIGPSYRSSVMQGGKPILRTAVEDEEPEGIPDPDETNKGDRPYVIQYRDPATANELVLLIDWLVETYGYKIEYPWKNTRRSGKHKKKKKKNKNKRKSAKRKKHHHKRSSSRRFWSDNDDQQSFESEEKASLEARRLNQLSIQPYQLFQTRRQDFKPSDGVKEASNTMSKQKISSAETLRLRRDREKKHAWRKDLKSFIKDLVDRMPASKMDQYTEPYVRAIEQQNNVKIADIDADKVGGKTFILVDYIDFNNMSGKLKVILDKRKRSNRHKKRSGSGVRKIDNT